MLFTLVYQGDLPPNGGTDEKWRIRRSLEKQIRTLWTVPPLVELKEYVAPEKRGSASYLGKSFEGLEYVPLISDILSLRAELDILLLSSVGPGGVVKHGDIDNRLKTLLDALSVPSSKQGIPKKPECEEDGRVFCLLEDDRLIVRIRVESDRYLEVQPNSNDCIAIIRVQPRASRVTLNNLSFAV